MTTPADSNKTELGKNQNLRVTCGITGIDTFCYRYTSPAINKLSQVKTGNVSQTALVMARVRLQQLEQIRNSCH